MSDDLTVQAVDGSQSISSANQRQMWDMLEQQMTQNAMDSVSQINQTYGQEQTDLNTSTGTETSGWTVKSF